MISKKILMAISMISGIAYSLEENTDIANNEHDSIFMESVIVWPENESDPEQDIPSVCLEDKSVTVSAVHQKLYNSNTNYSVFGAKAEYMRRTCNDSEVSINASVMESFDLDGYVPFRTKKYTKYSVEGGLHKSRCPSCTGDGGIVFSVGTIGSFESINQNNLLFKKNEINVEEKIFSAAIGTKVYNCCPRVVSISLSLHGGISWDAKSAIVPRSKEMLSLSGSEIEDIKSIISRDYGDFSCMYGEVLVKSYLNSLNDIEEGKDSKALDLLNNKMTKLDTKAFVKSSFVSFMEIGNSGIFISGGVDVKLSCPLNKTLEKIESTVLGYIGLHYYI